jgi:hypothetical protein
MPSNEKLKEKRSIKNSFKKKKKEKKKSTNSKDHELQTLEGDSAVSDKATEARAKLAKKFGDAGTQLDDRESERRRQHT